MKIEKHICDKRGCKKERAGGRSIQIFSHSTPDASGNGREYWQAKADLCEEHLRDLAQRLIGVIEDRKIPNPLKKIFDELDIAYEVV